MRHRDGIDPGVGSEKELGGVEEGNCNQDKLCGGKAIFIKC